jgi:hypothetical protein
MTWKSRIRRKSYSNETPRRLHGWRNCSCAGMVIPQGLNLLKLVRKSGKQVVIHSLFPNYACLRSASAHAILDSLTLLMSLRPRSSTDESLMPPASVIRQVYRTLPLDPSPGYHGTLPPIPASRTTALRDDNTIHLKSGALAAIDPALTSSTPSRPVAPTKGPNDKHHSHSNPDPFPPPHADCGHAYDVALYVLRSRLPKHCSVCVHVWYIHTHSGFVLPELWIDDHGLLILVWRGLRTGGNRWEGVHLLPLPRQFRCRCIRLREERISRNHTGRWRIRC